ncbi:MAG TPA: SHOCT domain-containing protein [Marmoricola sp.]|nr:SHOCT domain-containing protein [Marmoricola sp.]
MARTAVVAGTATAVSNRVSRRQAGRWAAQDQQQYQQQYQEPPPQQYQEPPPAAAPAEDDMITQLKKLGELRDAGVLTEEEFAAQKARILGT